MAGSISEMYSDIPVLFHQQSQEDVLKPCPHSGLQHCKLPEYKKIYMNRKTLVSLTQGHKHKFVELKYKHDVEL